MWFEKASFLQVMRWLTSTHSFLFLHTLYVYTLFCHSFTKQNKKTAFTWYSIHLDSTFNSILQMHVTQRVLQTWQNNKLHKHEDKFMKYCFTVSPGYTLLTTHNKYVVIFLDNIFVMVIVWCTIILFVLFAIPLHGTQLTPCLLAAQSIAWWEMCGHTSDAPHETPCFFKSRIFSSS